MTDRKEAWRDLEATFREWIANEEAESVSARWSEDEEDWILDCKGLKSLLAQRALQNLAIRGCDLLFPRHAIVRYQLYHWLHALRAHAVWEIGPDSDLARYAEPNFSPLELPNHMDHLFSRSAMLCFGFIHNRLYLLERWEAGMPLVHNREAVEGRGENAGALILRCRNELGWSQEELARKMGIDRKLVTRHESGKIAPSRRLAGEYAAAFQQELGRDGRNFDFSMFWSPKKKSP